MKDLIKKTPVIGSIATKLNSFLTNKHAFKNSTDYWIKRYENDENSGVGSYDKFASFKGEIINDFVKKNNVKTVIEFGSGDGNQLQYFEFEQYLGLDVSPRALEICREMYGGDPTKKFELLSDYDGTPAQLTMSLDVVYHLVEDQVFEAHMQSLFDSASEYVIVYASNDPSLNTGTVQHVLHRKFTDWVDNNVTDFELLEFIPNKYPFQGDFTTGCFADFYIYKRKS